MSREEHESVSIVGKGHICPLEKSGSYHLYGF